MSARQDPTRREDLLFMLLHGGASTNSIAGHVVDLAISEALDEQAAELARLRAERHSPNEALSDAAEQLRVQRDRIAELEAERDAHRAAYDCTCIDAPEMDAGQLLHASYCATTVIEDPHDSPLHHDYALGRDDVRFIPQQVTGRCPKGHTFEDCTCGGAA